MFLHTLSKEKQMSNHGIAYQNKDILSKILAENFKDKSLKVYGLDIPEIKQILPTNLPAVQLNEMRLDNLFLLADGSIAVIDYESSAKWENYLKYINYIVRILERYKQEEKPKQIRMIVIYTADVEQTAEEVSFGCLTLKLEQAFLSRIESGDVWKRLKAKVDKGEMLSDEELMEFIILPLTYKGKEPKKQAVKDTVELAKRIEDREKQTFVLAGILVFADKVIDQDTAEYIREVLRMTQVAELLLEEGIEKGIKKGRQEGIFLTGNVLQRLNADPGSTDQQIAQELGCTAEEVKEIRAILGK